MYTASFEIKEENGKIPEKENHTTVFPKGWSRQQLYDKCLFALNHKIKIEGTTSSYRSTTISGIPVEIHFDKDEKKIRTLYPVRTPRLSGGFFMVAQETLLTFEAGFAVLKSSDFLYPFIV